MWNNKFVQFIGITMFAGAMVALGAHELTKGYRPHAGNGHISDIIKDLHGDIDTQMASPRKSLFKIPSGESDKLESKDREELDQLINNVSK